MKVCIAEKPSVARDIAKVLGANVSKQGYIEGNGYQITWTFGHFCTLKQPHEYESYLKQWRLETLPIIPANFGISVMEDNGVRQQFNIIKKLVNANECTEVINCGDAGQEGELIQRWVLLKAKNKKPVKRLWISSLTEDAIKDGFANLKPEDDYNNLYAAGTSRAIGDWLLGINATRLFTLKFAPAKHVLSIGRVQTPTLALIVNRHHEIENFKSETYWELKTLYRNVLFSSDKGKIKIKDNAEKFIESIKNSDFRITSFSIKKGKEAPPKLFDLTSLQVECNKKFGMSADETLKTIQSLYEKKIVTYPRVDTQYLPDDMHPKIPQIMRGLVNYQQFTASVLQNKITKTKKIFDNKKITDHHAIIPTGVVANHLGGNEWYVYDTVTRRFIAAFYPDAIVSNTEVKGVAEKINFKATGKQILEENWKVLYKNDKQEKASDDKQQVMPNFTEGETGPHNPKVQEKKTSPPKHYSEATLLRAMETAGKQVDDEELSDIMKENGIGRPSTRAAIIETLFRRKYISKAKKRLEATPTGIQLIGSIKNDILKSVELTGQWERKLRMIEKGEFSVDDFKNEMNSLIINLVHEVKNDFSPRIETFDNDKPAQKNQASVSSSSANNSSSNNNSQNKKSDNKNNETVCPKCGKGHLIKGKSAYGCSNYKSGCDFTIPFYLMNKKLTDNQIKTLAKKKKSALIKGFIINDNKVNGHLILTESCNIEFEEKKEEILKCPECGSTVFIKGKNAFGCANYKNGCKFTIPFNIAGTDDITVIMNDSKIIKKVNDLNKK
ncbi:MAG: DNA topoisomerase 3 [Ichthyobacteriaceae bacterium]|nr:DNA topoisomerase 3 [Ichthyobacteriaceae bacterium]